MRHQDQLDAALLTLEQATRTWCPEARALQQETLPNHPRIGGSVRLNMATSACNRASLRDCDSAIIEPSKATMCLGDKCAFWRWHDAGERPQRHTAISQATWIEGHVDGAGEWYPADYSDAPQDGRDWVLDSDKGYWYVPTPALPPRGYCGKAGHPYQAALLEAQLEFLHHQIQDHRRAV